MLPALVLAVAVLLMTAAPAAAEPPHPDSAWNWLYGRLGTATDVTSDSTISPRQLYAAAWTGRVSGVFTPIGVTAPVISPSSVVVETPAKLPGGYRGIVAGRVTLATEPGRWVVQVYRDTAQGRSQVPLQAQVAPDGTFVVDLARAPAQPPGAWALGVLDAAHSYLPTGTPWPAPDVYAGWEVRALVTTDTTYLIGSQPASADGTFSFDSSRLGTKTFQLAETAGGRVLAEYAPNPGLLRSFGGSDRTYSYDQALGVLAALATDRPAQARVLTEGLLTLQAAGGGFAESAASLNPAGAAPIFRTGSTAVATYALLRSLSSLMPGEDLWTRARQGAVAGVAWLRARQRAAGATAGLLGAGRGGRNPDGTVDPGAAPTWISTEHNLDGWQALHLAAVVLGDSAAGAAADRVRDALIDRLWSTAYGRFLQGWTSTGPDVTDPLDVSSWGAIFLHAVGRDDLAAQAVAHLAAFASTDGGVSGQRAYYPQPVFPDAPPNVWFEGTAGVALARLRLGDTAGYADAMASVGSGQQPNGALPYATRADIPTGMTTEDSVASTAWFILATGAESGLSIWD